MKRLMANLLLVFTSLGTAVAEEPADSKMVAKEWLRCYPESEVDAPKNIWAFFGNKNEQLFYVVPPSGDLILTPYTLSERGFTITFSYRLSKESSQVTVQVGMNALRDRDALDKPYLRATHTLEGKEIVLRCPIKLPGT